MGKETVKLIANNKKAYHDYFIDETYEAGISLAGTEVKSVRMGKCSVKEAFIKVEKGEMYVYGMHISPYEKGNIFNKDPLRVRKLLLHRSEINKIGGKIAAKGYTMVPLKVYLKQRLGVILFVPVLFTLAATGVLSKLGFILGNSLALWGNGIGG